MLFTYVVASNCSRNPFISEKYQTVQSFQLISFNLCKSALLPTTVQMLETFLEAILWKPFQLFRRILNYLGDVTNAPSLQCWFQSREQAKISCGQVRRVWGILQCCHIVFANKSLTITARCAGVLSCQRNKLLVLHFTGSFLLIASLKRRKVLMYISLFTAASPLNYTSEFRELFEATAYLQDSILLDGAELTLLFVCKHCTCCKQTTLYFGQELVGIVINIVSIMS